MGRSPDEALTSKDIRAGYFKLQLFATGFGLLVLIVAVGVSLDKVKDRSCGLGYGLVGATCPVCDVAYCGSCDKNTSVCDSCKQSFYLNNKNQCKFCDEQGCSRCDSTGQCLECESTFSFYDGRCLSCLTLQGCLACSGSQCLKCDSGYYLEVMSGRCVPCRLFDPLCEACSRQDQCDACSHNIAVLSPQGKCQCNTVGNWNSDPVSDTCKCNGYVEADTQKCLRCD